MPFNKIVGIDWSGALNELRGEKVQVAEYNPATRTVRLVGPLRNPDAPWRRDDVLAYVQHEVQDEESTVLFGLDFAFAYPYCDTGTYFPGETQTPAGVQELWAKVDEVCGPDRNFYGGRFYRNNASPFKRYHRYPGYLGSRYRVRHRITEQQANVLPGLNPTSIFNCIGAAAVGPGSIAGMRFLHAVHNQTAAHIWPFDVNRAPDRSTVVEIYPRLFLRQAQNDDVQPTAENLTALCAYFGADLHNPPMNPTDDQRDALVSAAGKGRLVRQGPNWQVPDCAAKYEGWIFGVKEV